MVIECEFMFKILSTEIHLFFFQNAADEGSDGSDGGEAAVSS